MGINQVFNNSLACHDMEYCRSVDFLLKYGRYIILQGFKRSQLVCAYVIVIGLSVLGLKVKQGTFRKVVSSCNPPESVNTNLALSARPMLSK